MRYSTPLAKRLRISERRKQRYWSDPEFRLRCINETRAQAGLPPLERLPDTGPLVARDERGRFRRA